LFDFYFSTVNFVATGAQENIQAIRSRVISMWAHMDKDDLLMIYWTDPLNQIHSVKPNSKRVDEGLEFLLQALVFDPEESSVDSA